MRRSLLFLFISITFPCFIACNKEKPFSKKMMKGQIWNVANIRINNETIASKGQWLVASDIDIYDSVPRTKWINGNEDAIFEWQFQEKGKIFELSYVQQKNELDGDLLDSLDYLTYNLSGKYNVVVHKKKQMIFTSEKTNYYSGKIVEIEIER